MCSMFNVDINQLRPVTGPEGVTKEGALEVPVSPLSTCNFTFLIFIIDEGFFCLLNHVLNHICKFLISRPNHILICTDQTARWSRTT